MDQNGRGGSEERIISEFEKDLLLAFEEQENASLAPALSSPRPHYPSAKSLHPQNDREQNQSGPGCGRLEELKRGTPPRSQDQGEEPQKQQQRQEAGREAIREEHEDVDNGEHEPQGEERGRPDRNEEISRDNHHPKGGYCSPNTSDEDDEDPRPAKRQKFSSTRTDNTLTPPDEPTPVDNDDHHTSPTSRSPSLTVESAPVAEYREWPFQGFLKRITIGNQTTYNLEFTLPRIPEHLDLSLHSEVLSAGSRELSAEAVVTHKAVASRKPGKELTEEQESLLAKMVHEDKTWAEIGQRFPGHTLLSLKENFFTKQGGRPRKRGRKPGVRSRGT